MREFAGLYARLDATTSIRDKLAALEDYLGRASDEDAAWAVYFLAGGKPRQAVPSRVLRQAALQGSGLSPWLFEESYQAVGDLAETIALLLPESSSMSDRGLARWMHEHLLVLRGMPAEQLEQRLLAAWGSLGSQERFLYNKLITGGLRVGVSRQLVIRALAAVAGVDARLVAQRMIGYLGTGSTPDAKAYRALVKTGDAVADGDGGEHAGDAERALYPFPFFLAHALAGPVDALGEPGRWQAEWKWDGIRIQLVRRRAQVALWSRGEELVTDRFPEIVEAAQALPDGIVLDGELLCWDCGLGRPMPFAALQRRIGRRNLSTRLLREAPVRMVCYDLLEADGRDLREEPLRMRRELLEQRVGGAGIAQIGLSPLVGADDWLQLAALRDGSRERGVEGLMLKRLDSAYGIGRTRSHPDGDWLKWKVDPLTIDAVLIYAQRGHGRRASLYTDYTFALWDRSSEQGDGQPRLVPFAKAYSGLSDAQIRQVDAVIRKSTREKFGPVRSVEPTMVFELAFEAVQRSSRHKSGVAVRFPRILRLRDDKPVEQADELQTLLAMAG